jgi:hypothetical protein
MSVIIVLIVCSMFCSLQDITSIGWISDYSSLVGESFLGAVFIPYETAYVDAITGLFNGTFDGGGAHTLTIQSGNELLVQSDTQMLSSNVPTSIVNEMNELTQSMKDNGSQYLWCNNGQLYGEGVNPIPNVATNECIDMNVYNLSAFNDFVVRSDVSLPVPTTAYNDDVDMYIASSLYIIIIAFFIVSICIFAFVWTHRTQYSKLRPSHSH